MIVTRYRIKAPVKMKLALVADLHGEPTPELYEALKVEKPDIIACAGDMCTIGEYDDRLVDPERRLKRLKTQDGALPFLREAVKIAPVYYSRGNHEWGLEEVYRTAVKAKIAIPSDIHDRMFDLSILVKEKVDLILIPGNMCSEH